MLVTKEVKYAVKTLIEKLEREKAIVNKKHTDQLNLTEPNDKDMVYYNWLTGKLEGLEVAIVYLKNI